MGTQFFIVLSLLLASVVFVLLLLASGEELDGEKGDRHDAK